MDPERSWLGLCPLALIWDAVALVPLTVNVSVLCVLPVTGMGAPVQVCLHLKNTGVIMWMADWVSHVLWIGAKCPVGLGLLSWTIRTVII
jgi:hypothetical protein